ncbi:MAG: CoA transferase [Candidatus Hydrogenedens sp.]|nr:CoA transferase [Candidatus Hydrogenedens sp.]
MRPLHGMQVVSLAINAPGPVAAARLRDYGASVLKIEPPSGDPMNHLGAGWYEELTAGMEIATLDLKDAAGIHVLHEHLEDADLLLTANRPSALARLGITWDALQAKFPRLSWVAIVGFPPPNENEPGHDLNYQAGFGMLNPPAMPRVLVADMAGAERAVQEALALLLARERGGHAGMRYVALSEAARDFAVSVRYDVTTEGGVLGGGLPNYRVYAAREGYVACGALELHFMRNLVEALGVAEPTHEAFAEAFLQRTAAEWEDWGRERDLPLTAILG